MASNGVAMGLHRFQDESGQQVGIHFVGNMFLVSGEPAIYFCQYSFVCQVSRTICLLSICHSFPEMMASEKF